MLDEFRVIEHLQEPRIIVYYIYHFPAIEINWHGRPSKESCYYVY